MITASTNWDTFAPDMIVAATTGVFVGAVLLGAQAFTESRRARADSQFAWETFKPKIAGAAERSWIKSVEVFTVPSALVALDALTVGEPLALWKSHLKKPVDSLSLLLNILGQRSSFESTAIDVDLAAEQAIAEHGMTGTDAEAMRQMLRAHAHGMKYPDFDNYAPRWLESELRKLVEEPLVDEALGRYEISVAAYHSSIASLLSALNEEMETRMLRTFSAYDRARP